MTFNSTGYGAGVYTGNLCVTSNDPDPGPGNETDLVIVPVTLTVPAADGGGTDRPGRWYGPDACAGWRAAGCGGCCGPEHGDGRLATPCAADGRNRVRFSSDSRSGMVPNHFRQ